MSSPLSGRGAVAVASEERGSSLPYAMVVLLRRRG
jgi:hypothetical protein